VQQGGEGVKKAVAITVILVLHLVAACAPAAPTPTPTPDPTPTPIEVLATKPEHLAGTWFNPAGAPAQGRGLYYRFAADGTISWAYTLQGLQENPKTEARFWFEGGVYYEEGQICVPIGSYRVHLEINEGRAVGLRFEEIDDSDRSCYERNWERRVKYVRVD
jgi:hypothetical protein